MGCPLSLVRRHARPARPLLALLASASLFDAAAGSTVVVPDQYLAIQAAIDSGADTVLVKEGAYDESLVVTSPVALLSFVRHDYGGQIQQPRVLGLQASATTRVHGFRFTQPVVVAGTGQHGYWFESCRFDDTFDAPTGLMGYLYVRGCILLGNCTISVNGCEIVGNTFFRAHLNGAAEGYAKYLSNLFVGPADYALSAFTECVAAGNIVQGTTDGIIVSALSGDVRDNTVQDCQGTAYKAIAPGSCTFIGNVAEDCGGNGIEFQTFGEASGNAIARMGGDGIRGDPSTLLYAVNDNTIRDVGGTGIAGRVFYVRSNEIIGTGGHGIAVVGTAMDSNVVGRAGGSGIVFTSDFPSMIRSNTVYLSTDAGYQLDGGSADSVTHNIAYGSGGPGLRSVGAASPALACNDWFANAGGPTSGTAPGASDLAVDPMFCNVPADDVRLGSASPLLAAPGCGLIGALGAGCPAPVGAAPSPPGRGLEVSPSPASGVVRFAWPPAEGAARLEVFDVSGARRLGADLQPGARTFDWGFVDDAGRPVPAGIYLARIRAARRVLSGKVVRVP